VRRATAVSPPVDFARSRFFGAGAADSREDFLSCTDDFHSPALS
jgi:hypothetical protein